MTQSIGKIDSVTVTLHEPIEVGGKEYGEITLRKPLAGNLRGLSLTLLQAGNTDQVLKLASHLCDLPLSALERLTLGDITTINTLVTGFLYPAHLNDIVNGLNESGIQAVVNPAM